MMKSASCVHISHLCSGMETGPITWVYLRNEFGSFAVAHGQPAVELKKSVLGLALI